MGRKRNFLRVRYMGLPSRRKKAERPMKECLGKNTRFTNILSLMGEYIMRRYNDAFGPRDPFSFSLFRMRKGTGCPNLYGPRKR